MTKWSDGEMITWQNDHLTKWSADMTSWQNNHVQKWVDKMIKWQNDQLVRWSVVKMICWQNDLLAKWSVDKPLSWQNYALTTNSMLPYETSLGWFLTKAYKVQLEKVNKIKNKRKKWKK